MRFPIIKKADHYKNKNKKKKKNSNMKLDSQLKVNEK